MSKVSIAERKFLEEEMEFMESMADPDGSVPERVYNEYLEACRVFYAAQDKIRKSVFEMLAINPFSDVPSKTIKFLDGKGFELIFRLNPGNFRKIPDEFKTLELCKEAIKKDALNFHDVPKSLCNQEILELYDEKWLGYVPMRVDTY